MTGKRKFLAWTALLGSALAARMGLALAAPNVFYPDEIFQTLEPAHRLAFGYGAISWEWRLGIRSWVFPSFLAAIMRSSAWLGSGSSGYLLATAIVLSLISLTAVWFGYAWARRASGTPAAMVAAVACSFYFGLVYFAPKAMTGVVAAHVLLPGLYLGVYGEKLGERKRLFLAALLCGTAACLRIQLLPALAYALLYFCYPRWRQRLPIVAAGVSVPVLLFGAVDWITWSYPWQSFIGYFAANMHGRGTIFPAQPWYWYLLIVVVLVGPAVLLLFHGARRSPFLAIFCAIIIVSHSVIAHKEVRFIYPILAPAITLASMGIVDLLAEIKGGFRLLDNPKWVVAIGVTALLLSSATLTDLCARWYTTRWGAAAFDGLSHDGGLCGVGIYGAIWSDSGGYAHLHRNVPIIPVGSDAELVSDAPLFNALIAPRSTEPIPAGFAQTQCWGKMCLLQRPGTCTVPSAGQELNAYLQSHGS